MDASTKKLFAVMHNLYDVVAMQQAQLDGIAVSHFRLGDAVRVAFGIDPEATPPPPPNHAAIAKAKLDIVELERIFNQPEDGKEKR
jgi:hypothetical protein